MHRFTRLSILASFVGGLVIGAWGCTRAAPSSPGKGKAKAAGAPLPSVLHEPATLPPAKKEPSTDVCERLRLLRENCDRSQIRYERSDAATRRSLEACALLPSALTTEALTDVQVCLTGGKKAYVTDDFIPVHCAESPVTECLVQVIQARVRAQQTSGLECEELELNCLGRLHDSIWNGMCRVIESTVALPYRKHVRACAASLCDSLACAGRLLSWASKSDAAGNVPMIGSSSDSPCLSGAANPLVFTAEALEGRNACPSSYSEVREFLWFLDVPAEPQFVEECGKLVHACDARQREGKVRLRLTQRPCRTAFWATKPQYRRELGQCIASACDAVECVDRLRRRMTKD